MRCIYLQIALILFSWESLGQPSNQSDLMFSKEITRAIDLREKQNEPLYSAERELPKLLIDATLAGIITPYFSDSLGRGQVIPFSTFQERITIETGIIPQDTAYMDDYEKEEYLLSLSNGSSEDDYFFGRDFHQLELTETMFFSKKTSEMRHHIKSLTIFLPADHPDNLRGIQKPIATYDFKEVIQIFKNDPNAIWYNPKNDSEHRSLEEAFELRLFSSYIIKVSNPQDELLSDIYKTEQESIIQAQEKDYELLEYENNLWEH